MIQIIDSDAGVRLMRAWGVTEWDDPGAEYALWKDACIFALVQQDGFVDIHMAMMPGRHNECRDAGADILSLISHLRLRAIILPDRIKVCNYASRMGFTGRKTEHLQTINGSTAPFFVMWREPGEYDGRSNQRFRRGGK